MEEEHAAFPVRSRSGQTIHDLVSWFQLAPPAGRGRQWRQGRSALELARRWMGGRLPDEVNALLATSDAFRNFEPCEAVAECRTRLDRLAGNTRNHDLLVIGRVGGVLALLDVEGKADEPFGPTIAQRASRAIREQQDNPRSRARERVVALCRAVFAAEPEEVGDLRYQLLHAISAAVLAAQARGARRVAWVAHEFLTNGVNSSRVQANARDLHAFVARLAGHAVTLTPLGGLAGPISLPGLGNARPMVELYMGKATRIVDEPTGDAGALGSSRKRARGGTPQHILASFSPAPSH